MSVPWGMAGTSPVTRENEENREDNGDEPDSHLKTPEAIGSQLAIAARIA